MNSNSIDSIDSIKSPTSSEFDASRYDTNIEPDLKLWLESNLTRQYSDTDIYWILKFHNIQILSYWKTYRLLYSISKQQEPTIQSISAWLDKVHNFKSNPKVFLFDSTQKQLVILPRYPSYKSFEELHKTKFGTFSRYNSIGRLIEAIKD